MINSNVNWNGNAAKNIIVKAGWEAIQRVTVYFWSATQQTLNVSAKVGKGTKASDYQASKPGEPPRKRTGFLQANDQYELDEASMSGRVGITSNAKYGLFLEFGTSKMAARPWLSATLKKVMPQLQAIIASLAGKP